MTSHTDRPETDLKAVAAALREAGIVSDPPTTEAERRLRRQELDDYQRRVAASARKAHHNQVTNMLRVMFAASKARASCPDEEHIEVSEPDHFLDDAINVADLNCE